MFMWWFKRSIFGSLWPLGSPCTRLNSQSDLWDKELTLNTFSYSLLFGVFVFKILNASCLLAYKRVMFLYLRNSGQHFVLRYFTISRLFAVSITNFVSKAFEMKFNYREINFKESTWQTIYRNCTNTEAKATDFWNGLRSNS